MLDDAVNVELVENWIGVFRKRRSEHDDLVDLSHRLEETCLHRNETKKDQSFVLLSDSQRRRMRSLPSTPGLLIT